MFLFRTLLLLIMGLYCATGYSQWIGKERIDSSKVKPWSPATMEAYEHVYEFGEGETHCYLLLIHAGDEWYAQTKIFISDAFGNLKPKYVNFDSVNVKWEGSGKFYSKPTNGAFVTYRTDSGKKRGLKVERYWNAPLHSGDDYELGLRYKALHEFYDGQYTRTSRSLLEKRDLRNMTAEELRIMRNEIFARYGYDFRDGGEMEEHFSQKD